MRMNIEFLSIFSPHIFIKSSSYLQSSSSSSSSANQTYSTRYTMRFILFLYLAALLNAHEAIHFLWSKTGFFFHIILFHMYARRWNAVLIFSSKNKMESTKHYSTSSCCREIPSWSYHLLILRGLDADMKEHTKNELKMSEAKATHRKEIRQSREKNLHTCTKRRNKMEW